MSWYKSPPVLLIGILITIFFGISLFFRIYLPYDQVISGDWIKYTSNDAYYHMRLVDSMVHNFPNLTHFDPYFIYPGGAPVSGVHFFDWLLSIIILVIGLGSPTQHLIDVAGAYYPTVLAALTVIPVFFIGKALFNRWAGLLAAALVAILPGEFLGRSILAFTDNHVAETLFSTIAVLFLILAIKESGQKSLTFNHFIQRDWKVIIKPFVYSLLAGIFLGIYLITWAGALLFVFIISLYFIIQFIIDHLRHKPPNHLGIVGFISLLAASIIFLPLSPARDLSVAQVIALFIPLALLGISRLISSKGLKPVYYPLTLIGIGIVGIAIFKYAFPDIFSVILVKFRFIFMPTGSTATTTMEMQPFLSPQGSFSTAVAWGNFTTSFFLIKSWPIPGFALISFIILIWICIKQRSDERHLLLFLIWTLVILVATLVQRRFAYYLVVNIALLSAYISWQAIWRFGFRKLEARPGKSMGGEGIETTKTKTKKKNQEKQSITIYHINTILAVIIIFFFVFFFNIIKAKEVASQVPFAPSDAWQASLIWMKEKTPEPFSDPDAYYKLYEPPPSGENFTYPKSAYGVAAWWDYGYWISRTAHRLPNTNPSQEPKSIIMVAGLFLSQEESSANKIMDELKSSYIIADFETSTSKFWAVVTWAGQEQDKYVSTYYLPQEGKLIPIQLFHLEYYHSMFVKLYNFDGKSVTEESPVVVTYNEKIDSNGNHYRQIADIDQYSSYKEALDYVNTQKSGKCDIVGINPFISPIPLEAVQSYKLVYSSDSSISYSENGTIPEIKIFEYIGG